MSGEGSITKMGAWAGDADRRWTFFIYCSDRRHLPFAGFFQRDAFTAGDVCHHFHMAETMPEWSQVGNWAITSCGAYWRLTAMCTTFYGRLRGVHQRQLPSTPR